MAKARFTALPRAARDSASYIPALTNRRDPSIRLKRVKSIKGRREMKTVALALALSSTLFVSACANMNDTEQRVVSGAAIGGASGAALGAVTGGLSIGAGALIGAAAGAAGGYIVDQSQK
jgi:hypothetical protein